MALDAIAVVANPDNPVEGLTLQQISDMYTGRITRRWTGVGGEDRPVVLLSRESNSGTYVYFLEQVVRLGDAKSTALFSPETLLMPSSQGISAEVTQNPNAIGYDGLGYVTAEQKMIAVARTDAGPYVLPSAQTVLDNTYPVSRPLYMYTAGQPTGEVKRYLDWIMGDGQDVGDASWGSCPLAGRTMTPVETHGERGFLRVRRGDTHPDPRLLHHRLRRPHLPLPAPRGAAGLLRGAARQPLLDSTGTRPSGSSAPCPSSSGRSS